MKYSIILLFTISFFSCSRRETKYQFSPPDQDGYYIYIDTKDSEYYKYISDLSFDKWDTISYRESIDIIKKGSIKPFDKLNLPKIPLKWTQLWLYNNNYYIYAPSDWSLFEFTINDSTTTAKAMESAEAADIISIKQTAENTYQIERQLYYNGINTLKIHIVDSEKGIAVFENTFNHNPNSYILMVDASKVRNFPVIVNQHPNHRVGEFEFDLPDFKALLSKTLK